MKKYKWIAECSDGAFNDESALFNTEKECYNNMRNAVLEKMKWNTEYDEDLGEVSDDEYIGYDVRFQRRKITHKSHSGLYTYRIVEVKEKKSYHVWQSFQGSICVDVMAEDEDEAYRIGSKILQDMPDVVVVNNADWHGVQVDLN
jgi:hypothetical protein